MPLVPGTRIGMIVNPIAGPAGSRRLWQAFCVRLKAGGMACEVHQTRRPGDAGRFAGECCRAGVSALVVVGGDGTINEAVSGMVAGGVPILIVPAGTENVLAKYLDTRPDPDWLWRVLAFGREARFDVLAMNGRRFLLVAGVGFDAEVVRRTCQGRGGHITYFDYFWNTWRCVWGYHPPAIRVEVDDVLLHQGPCWVFVGNIPRYALGVPVLSRASLRDGLLDVCVVAYDSPPALWWQSLKILLRRHIGSHGVFYRQGKRVRVRSESPVSVQIDGDYAGTTPAVFEMTREKARFLVSPDWRP